MSGITHSLRYGSRMGVLILGLWSAGLAQAADTNVAPTPVQPVDYRQMLQRVRERTLRMENLEIIQQAIRSFQMRFGRLPADLNELQARGLQGRLPPPPSNMVYEYDRQLGNVRLAVAVSRVEQAPAASNQAPAGLMVNP